MQRNGYLVRMPKPQPVEGTLVEVPAATVTRPASPVRPNRLPDRPADVIAAPVSVSAAEANTAAAAKPALLPAAELARQLALVEAHQALRDGDEAALLDLVLKVEETADGEMKWLLSDVLATWNKPSALPYMIEWGAQIEDDAARMGLTRAAAGMIDYQNFDLLMQHYRASTNPAEREWMADAVWSIEHTNANLRLARYLSGNPAEDEREVAGAAASVLASSGRPAVVEALLAVCRPGTGVAADLALDAVASVSNPASFALLVSEATGAMPEATIHSRLACIRALAQYPGEYARRTLNGILSSEPNPDLYRAALDALSLLASAQSGQDGEMM